MANGDIGKMFSEEQIHLNERYLSSRENLDRMKISPEGMEEIKRQIQSDKVQQLVNEFEASPGAQNVLKAFKEASAEIKSLINSDEAKALTSLYDAHEQGANAEELYGMAVAKGVSPAADAALGSSAGGGGRSYQTMLDYLERVMNEGSLQSADYNKEADGLIFSYLAYASKFLQDDEYYKLAMLDENTTMSVKDYLARLIEKLEKNSDVNDNDLQFLKRLAQCGRYMDLEIVYSWGEKKPGEVQDHLIAVKYDDGGYVFAIEGTDGTYNGWSTNKDLLSPEMSPAEEWVRDRISELMENFGSEGPYDFVGHSRGGHLAISSLLLLETDLLNYNIRSVTAFDPPGFNKEFIDKNWALILQFQDIIQNFYISNSVVGAIGEPIGNIKYIKMSESMMPGASHDAYFWALDEAGHFIETEQSTISKLVHALLEYALDNLTMEEIGILYEGVLQLLRTGDNGEFIGDGLTIEQFLKNLLGVVMDGTWGEMGDVLTKLFLNHPAVEFFDLLKDAFDITGKICDVLSLIPVVGPYFATASEILTIASLVVDILNWTFQICYDIYKMMREKEREAYINRNEVINIDINAMIPGIAEKLEKINRLLRKVDRDFDQLYYCVELEPMDVVTLGFSALLSTARKAGLDLTLLHESSTIRDMENAVWSVYAIWKNGVREIAGALRTNTYDNCLIVNPNQLTSLAESAKSYAQKVETEYIQIVNKIEGLRTHWSGADYASFRQKVRDDKETFMNVSKLGKNYYDAVTMVANRYGSLQSRSVEVCQNAKPWYR